MMHKNVLFCKLALQSLLILSGFTFQSLLAQSVGINADGATPNANAMLDIKSPATGNGKGLLIPRVTKTQRTSASSALAGGLLNDSGKLRGGAAQGLLVYQTNDQQGFYYNTSTTTTPSWVYVGTGGGSVTSVTAGSGLSGGTITQTGTISLPNTGTAGTYTKVTTDSKGRITSGTTLSASDIPNLDASKITTGTLEPTQGGFGSDLSGTTGLVYISEGSSSGVSITSAGRNLIDDTSASAQRTTLGLGTIATQTVPYTMPNANGTNGQVLTTNGSGTASWGGVSLPVAGSVVSVGDSVTNAGNGVAIGVSSRSTTDSVAVGYQANSDSGGSTLGYQARGDSYGVAVGYQANGYDSNVAIGYNANAYTGSGPYVGGVSVGYSANCYSGNGKYCGGVAVGYRANARHNANENQAGAVAIGFQANSYVQGAAVGWKAAGYNQGTAVGYQASGSNNGTAIGWKANAATGSYATAVGYQANGGGSKNFTFAKGAFSKCERYNEEWKCSDGLNNKFGQGMANFHGATTTNSATEIFLGGESDRRFTIMTNSAVTFQALVTAINTNTGDTSVWRIFGGIKQRANAGTTALIGAITIDSKTEGGLLTDPIIDADTTNGSLRVRVTGVAANTVVWNVAISYSEVRE